MVAVQSKFAVDIFGDWILFAVYGNALARNAVGNSADGAPLRIGAKFLPRHGVKADQNIGKIAVAVGHDDFV